MDSPAEAHTKPSARLSNEEVIRLIHAVHGNNLPPELMSQLYQLYGGNAGSESTSKSAASDEDEDDILMMADPMAVAREEEKASVLARLDPTSASYLQACFKEDEDNENLPSSEWNEESADDLFTRHMLSKMDPHGKHLGNPAYKQDSTSATTRRNL